MSRVHRSYLLLEQGVGAAVVNFAINAAIAWALFGSLATVPLWGQWSIMGDTIGTSVILPLLTCLIVTPTARHHVRVGRVPPLGWSPASRRALGWLPHGTLRRGLVLGVTCLVVLVPPTWAALVALDVASLSPRQFIVFKGAWAAGAAALVTPLIALRAITEPAPARA